jgi:hypothetical protein
MRVVRCGRSKRDGESRLNRSRAVKQAAPRSPDCPLSLSRALKVGGARSGALRGKAGMSVLQSGQTHLGILEF